MSLDKRSIELGTEGWGVKEDNLLAFRKDRTRYVEKPFTFSRASEGTIINSDGLIEYAGVSDVELVTNGSFDQDSNWNYNPTYWDISNGTLNSLGVGNSQISQQLIGTVSGKYYLISIPSIKNISGGTGVFSVVLGSNTAIINDNSESINIILQASVNNSLFYISPGSSSFNIDNISVKEVLQDFARIDYSTGDDALLLEPARTNLIERSNLSSYLLTTQGSIQVTSSDIDFIFSGQKAKLITTNGNSSDYISFPGTFSATAYTTSFFVKKYQESEVTIETQFHQSGLDASYVTINFDNKTVTPSPNGAQGQVSIDEISSDWFRVSTTTNLSSNRNTLRLIPRQNVYMQGLQLEQGSYATSYIPTFGTSVTRAAEAANNCGAVQDFNDDEGVLFAEILGTGDNQHPSNIYNFVSINNGLNNHNIVAIGYREDTKKFFIVVRGGNTTSFVEQNLDFEFNKYYRIALKYKSGNSSIFINGDKINDYTQTFSITGLTKLSFDYGGVDYTAAGLKTKEIKVYPETLNDAELRLLTKYAPKDYDAAFTADYVDNLAEFTVLRTEVTDKLYYSISDGTNSVSGSATITATQVTISNIDISSLTDGTLTLSVYIEDERKQRGVTVTDTTIKDTTNTPLYSYALQQRATGATFEDLDNSESIIESLNVEV
jgi:hypothetical protein